MISKTLYRVGIAAALAVAVTLVGCSGSSENKTVRIGYVDWDSCVAGTNVVSAVLEQAGFEVDEVSVTAGMMYQGLASGDLDATVCAWLPTTHANYYAKTKDDLDNLGHNMSGTRVGLVVPDYVQIDSIPELVDNKAEFDNRIVGIDPGAGIMGQTKKAIQEYNLPEKLVVGSDAAMTAALGDAIDHHEPIVVTGWTPHWMWARWDLKYLQDPKGVYGQPEYIDTLVHKGFKKDMPKAYAILNAFQWSSEEMGKVMAADRKKGADRKADAKEWVKNHQQKVSSWLGD